MAKENRRHFRERMIAEVGYKNEKNQSFGGCLAKDISESGVCIKIREFIPIGTMLELQFKLPLSNTFFYIKGKVMRINKTINNDEWEAGLEMQMNTTYSSLVKKYIAVKNSQRSY